MWELTKRTVMEKIPISMDEELTGLGNSKVRNKFKITFQILYARDCHNGDANY